MALTNDTQIAQVDFTSDERLLNAMPFLVASSTKYDALIICPVDEGIVIEAANCIWTTAAGTSGTVDLVKVASGTAASSGTSILTSTVSIAGTAETVNAFALNPTKNFVPAGSILYAKVVHGGTVSAGLQIQIRWRKVSKDVNLKG